MKIFCINLLRATDRKQFITEKWVNNLNLDIHFWTAYDKILIEQNQHYYQYDDELCKQKFHRSLNSGEIACATSFYQLYEYILQNNIDECIIIEDDIIPLVSSKDILFSRLNAAKLEFPVSELILMHNICNKQKNNFDPTYGATYNDIYNIKGDSASLCRKIPWGNQCFYITNNAIKKIYENLCKETHSPIIWHPADYSVSPDLCKTMEVCILNEPICDHDWDCQYTPSCIGH